mmetsp:Transcript_13793/g.32625  ORF Transcript_13793/g.32625 Transcript_13793/m.32625 type:complete len:153 (+) Transcript_13793:131-589(+)
MTGNPNGFATLQEAADAVAKYTGRPTRDHSGLKKNLRQGVDGRWRWHWDPDFLNGSRLHGESMQDPSAGDADDIGHRLDAAVAAIEVPVLLVRGRISDVVTKQEVRHFLDICPHAEAVDVSDAAHMVAGDRNDVFNKEIIDFVQRLYPKAAL